MADPQAKQPDSKKRKSLDNSNNGSSKKQNNKKKETFDGEDVQISSTELEETNYYFKDGPLIHNLDLIFRSAICHTLLLRFQRLHKTKMDWKTSSRCIYN